MDEARKAEVNRLLDIFLNDLESVAHDAGWSGESMVSQYTKYLTQIQWSNKANPDGKMLHETRLLRRSHPRLVDAKAMMAAIYGKRDRSGRKVGRKYAEALLSQRYYLHDHLDHETHKVRPYTNADRAKAIRQPIRSYKRRLVAGYQMADEILLILEIRREITERAA